MKRNLEDWLDSYIKFTDSLESPLLFHKWVGVSVIAAVLQRKCRLQMGLITQYPNLYVVLVAPSGKARKGTAMGPGYEMLEDLGIKMAAEAITREALIRELKNSNDTIIYDDGRTEFHASLTIFSQELTVFLGFHNQQLMSDLTDWFDCRSRWTYRTKNMGTDEIIGVWVNLIGATTPELIQSSMPMDAIGGGLTSRIIFVFENKKRKCVPLPFLTEEEIRLRELLLQDLEKIHLLRGDFKVSQSFIDKWVPWYSALDKNQPFQDDRFNGYFQRRQVHLLKLSMIFSASRGDDMQLTGEDFDRALALLRETEVKMPYTFSGVGKSAIADVVNRVMTEIAVQGKCTFAHLMGRFYHDVDKGTLQKIIASLEAMKFIRMSFDDSGQQVIVYNKESSHAIID